MYRPIGGRTQKQICAKKLIELDELATDSPIDMEIKWGGSLIQAALKHLGNPEFVADNTSPPAKKRHRKEETVYHPWENWLTFVVTETVEQQRSAKMAFRQACLCANVHTDRTTHIALTSLGGVVSAVATEGIEVRGLIFPCFFRRATSLLCSSDTATRSHKEVKGCVYWTAGGEADGSRKPTVTIPLFVQPEVRHRVEQRKAERADQLEDCHPFWHIQRSCCDGEYNCEVEDVLTTVLHTSYFDELNDLGARVKTGYQSYHVKFPCIVNTKKICAGEQVFLKWTNDETKRKQAGAKSATAFDNLVGRARKRPRYWYGVNKRGWNSNTHWFM